MKKHKFDLDDEKTRIIESIQRIKKDLNRTPTQKDYKRYRSIGDMSLEQIVYRYGRYSEAIKAAGLIPNDFQIPPRSPELKSSDLIDEFIRVVNLESRIPSKEFFRANSKYSWTPYKTKWGSWKKAIEYITANHKDSLNLREITLKKNSRTRKTNLLLKECCFIYEPVNEIETIALFSILADELGFKILKIQSDFPDGLVEFQKHKIEVEFEFLSSNYLLHGHPLDFTGQCICWRKDCDLGKIKVLSLEEYIRSRYK